VSRVLLIIFVSMSQLDNVTYLKFAESILKKAIPQADILEANTVGEFLFAALDKKIAFPSVVKCITLLIRTVYAQPVCD
jgi:hypothetical protein